MGRWWMRIATIAVVALLVGFVLLAPVQAAGAARGTWHAMPGPVRAILPDSAEKSMGEALDGYVRALTSGDAGALITLPLRLESSTPDVGGWSGGTVTVSWKPLEGAGIEYMVAWKQLHGEGTGPGPTVSQANVTATMPGPGRWMLEVTPTYQGDEGRTTRFGPYGWDTSPPTAPVLSAIANVTAAGYLLSWSASTDAESGIASYTVERSRAGGPYHEVAIVEETTWMEGARPPGTYQYRVRAINGADVASEPSQPQTAAIPSTVTAPTAGALTFGVHANYESLMHVWDLTDPSKYYTLEDLQAPEHAAVRGEYLGVEWGVDTQNQTLRTIVATVVGEEQNTLTIAEKLFTWLYDRTDYSTAKAQSGDQTLLRAGQTLDAGGGICGDLAVLYLTLLRIAGVPARPVHGYLDNPRPEDPIQGEFHMWVEVYVGGDADTPWMTVDVSGASNDAANFLFLFFGVFNPDYLALGEEKTFDPLAAQTASWNAWARVSWTCTGGPCPAGFAKAEAVATQVEESSKFLLVDKVSRERVLVAADGDQPDLPDGWNCSDQRCIFWRVNDRVTKRIDYGLKVENPPASLDNVTIALRLPEPDAQGSTNAFQTAAFQVYQGTQTLSTYDQQAGFVERKIDY